MARQPMDEDRQCRATSKQSKQRCKRAAIRGGTVCAMHGGKTPQVVNAAQARLEHRKALKAAETFGLPREVDPHTALLEELHRTAGAVEWLGAFVAELKNDEVTWGILRRKTGGEDRGVTREARLNIWAAEWRNERKHLVAVAKECISLGIEERRVRLAEESGRQLAGVLRAVLDRLDLSEDQQRLATVIVPEEFRRLAAAEPRPDTDEGGAAEGGGAA